MGYLHIYPYVLPRCSALLALRNNRNCPRRPSWALCGLQVPSKTHLNAVQVPSKRNLDPTCPFKLASQRNLDSTWPFKLLSKGSKMAFGAPSWALHGQHELQLAFQLPFQSAPDLQNHQFSLGKPWFLQGGAVCCRIALGLLFCSSWTPLGRLWSPTWSLLGVSWSVLGNFRFQLLSKRHLDSTASFQLASIGCAWLFQLVSKSNLGSVSSFQLEGTTLPRICGAEQSTCASKTVRVQTAASD